MKNKNIVIFIGVIVSLICKSECFKCDRKPEDIDKPSSKAGPYLIEIEDKPESYIPHKRYKLFIKTPEQFQETSVYKFKQFILTLESKRTRPEDSDVIYRTGKFELGEDKSSKFSESCPNMVTEINKAPKTEVYVYWKAPPPNSGCVAIKAAVIESRDNWFTDEDTGPLTKVLCEDKNDDEDIQPEVLAYCCTCHEAKYELEFEGKWTRNTHPKGFPEDLWTTRFSDIIGSSHGLKKGFWEYGGTASRELEQLALEGDTSKLETTLKQNIDNLRTIIKARGLHYPKITSSTYAVFRVDPENHLLSIVSKFSPSPDWIVGVADLELCMEDCTWKDSRTLNLYPWDIGVDDAVEYTKSEIPSNGQRHPITRITSTHPNDTKSPFYGEDIKPIAKLHVTRQKIYKQKCDPDRKAPACSTSPWSPWSDCSKSCGTGVQFKTRNFLNINSSASCEEQLYDQRECYNGRCSYSSNDDDDDDIGEETNSEETSIPNNKNENEIQYWSDWSNCSVACGWGHMTRDLKVSNPQKMCSIVACEETLVCNATICEGSEQPTASCPNVIWSKWTSCSVTCGIGVKSRNRIPAPPTQEDPEGQSDCPSKETVECYEPTCGPESDSYIVERWATGPVEDCKVSKWSPWSVCQLDGRECGKGFKYKYRWIKKHPLNGGKACPKELMKQKGCRIPCSKLYI